MIGVVITGHGNYASGLLNAVHLVAGEQEAMKAVDFVKGMSTAELEKELAEAAGELGTRQILILADLVGGSPFNTASMLRGKLEGKQVKILAGTNMAMAVETVFARGAMELDSLAADVLGMGAQGIMDLDQLLAGNGEPEGEGL